MRLNQVRIDREWLLAGSGGKRDEDRHRARAPAGCKPRPWRSAWLRRRSTISTPKSISAPDLARPTAPNAPRAAQSCKTTLLALAGGEPVCTNDELRAQANSIVLRATQAALAAAKGTGYVVGHPAGRWCREALFFLVWSCPQGVMAANLCELAGLE